MKALQIIKESEKPELKLVDLPTPRILPGHALIKVKASAINPSDVLNAAGGFPGTTFPRVPGRDFAGIVEEGTQRWIGKEVYGTSGSDFSFTEDGAHAEYCLVQEDGLVQKPTLLSFSEAASIGVTFTTASLALNKATPSRGETVMVLGATGAVGSAAVQLAREAGCKVITVARSDSADINSKTDPQLTAAKKLTEGKGADIVIDTVGSGDLTVAAIAALSKGGRYSFISAPRSSEGPNVPINLFAVYRNEISLHGCNSGAHPQASFAGLLRGMTNGFESGRLKPMEESSMTAISLDEAIEAYGVKGKRFVIRFD